jgi:phosphatidylserine/phosphatidylglycerophosphate/cardiolipin synthase-like enzyme
MFFPHKTNIDDLAQIIRRASKTLEVCVFAFTNDKLSDALLFAFRKGVAVRLICDDECAKFNGAEVWRLGLEGVPATIDDNVKAHMHNKYCLIDSEVLITGSFNWTSQAVSTNQENLIIIQDPHFVREYQANFEQLWEQFKPQMLTNEVCRQKLLEEQLRIKKNQEKAAETRRLKKELI